ncbi:cellulase family glycosylhydrolase [Pseudomonas frederiksbergensis]|uniref:cellulase family glycosylhydrolase n=1 Tax=Pseudomonas frederiksbergensis TaxID=104087 RepID=UPI000F465A23|nr:cellulase family glycosylhydrolase [Pseudomonas frederiksbergensis]RON45316.1 glycosyl hydrolase family 5 [Pseudomonas frederiksbergensis]
MHAKRLAACTLLMLSSANLVHASDLFPALSAKKTFGVQVKIQNFTPADAGQIKQAGFGFVRFGVWTNSLADSAYQKQISDAFAVAKSAGLPVLMTIRSTDALTATPGNASELKTAGALFAKSVVALEQSYRQQLVAIEIWNEPDLDKYWPTGNFETTFVPFMSAVCQSLGPNAQTTPLIGFGFAKAPSAGSASTVALNRIVSEYPKCLSAISYHPYGQTGAQISNAQAFIQQNFHLPGVISEWGVSALSSNGGDDGQASKVSTFISDVEKLKIPLTSVYEWKNSDSGGNDRERNFGLLTADGHPKPAETAVRTLLNSN